MSTRPNHPAFSYAVLVSLAGGAGYVLKRHVPSLVGGQALGAAFLGAGLLAISDAISEHTFAHGTSLGMAAIIAGVMGRRALRKGIKGPHTMIASLGAAATGYHLERLVDVPSLRRFVPGADHTHRKRGAGDAESSTPAA